MEDRQRRSCLHCSERVDVVTIEVDVQKLLQGLRIHLVTGPERCGIRATCKNGVFANLLSSENKLPPPWSISIE
jgi:hypothetical protein